MEYKVFIMGILNDLYLIREDVKEGPGHDAISALINKIESCSMDTIKQEKGIPTPVKTMRSEAEIAVSTTEHEGVYVYQFKK